jgi:hypothetical protein
MSTAIENCHACAQAGDRRAVKRLLKLTKMALLMDLSKDVEDGMRKSLHPIARRRRFEKRRPRIPC